MIAVRRRKLGVSISDIFFAAQPETTEHPPAALALFVQAKEYSPGFRPFKTQLVELTKAEGVLYDSLSSSTRYKIQRAAREGLYAQVEVDPSGESIQEYIGHSTMLGAWPSPEYLMLRAEPGQLTPTSATSIRGALDCCTQPHTFENLRTVQSVI
jgi:hypothetical protein